MAKRRAEEALEEVFEAQSPASKKSKVDKTYGRPSNGTLHANGHEQEIDERNGKNILAAADEEAEQLEEAGVPSEDEENEEEPSAFNSTKRQNAPVEGFGDLYLDTIKRSVLDFDFEKLCSVTLSNINVYACLVCGTYYQGRGPKSHAYFHALDVGHHVFVNMGTKKVYVLPEGYEVKSSSLDDIKFVVDPRLSKDEVLRLDTEGKEATDLSGRRYRPGQLRDGPETAETEADIFRFCRNEQYQTERLFQRHYTSSFTHNTPPELLHARRSIDQVGAHPTILYSNPKDLESKSVQDPRVTS